MLPAVPKEGRRVHRRLKDSILRCTMQVNYRTAASLSRGWEGKSRQNFAAALDARPSGVTIAFIFH